MKKGTNLLVSIACGVILLTVCAIHPLFSFRPSVASAVYEEVYNAVTEDVYELPVYLDVYFDGVDEHYLDPFLPDDPLQGLEEDCSFTVEQRVTNVAVGHDYAVYNTIDGDNSDIWVLDLVNTETKQITNDIYEQSAPSIYGNIVVWQDYRNGNWDIYLYDLNRNIEYQLTADPSDQLHPSIYKNTVVWQDNRNGNWDIYSVNLLDGEELALTSSTDYQTNPEIFANHIAWQSLEANGNWQIYVHNRTTTETNRISEDFAQNCSLSLSRERVVWTKFHENKWYLMTSNLREGQLEQLSGFPVYLSGPKLYDRLMVYNGSDSLELESNLYELTTKEKYQVSLIGSVHHIFGTRVIWVTSQRNGPQILHVGHLIF